MESLWKMQTKDIKAGELPERPDRVTWDVIVVGAGMAGLLIAYFLQKKGKKVLVLEADTICSGQTAGTTAKITSQHGIKYCSLIKTVGRENARCYARANELAIREYEKLVRELKIDCQFQKAAAYLYTTQDETLLEKEREAALSLGIDVISDYEEELPFAVKGMIGFPGQASFSPLEFAKRIAGELTILEHSPVVEVKEHLVATERGMYTAEKIVIATHYPIVDFPGFYFLRQHQSRSYVLALSGCKEINGMYLGVDGDALSFRQAGEYLLFGGASHRTGAKSACGAYEYLERKAREYYPECKIEARWSAQDCMPHDGIPFIGQYSVYTPNIYVATGFQKWGMTTSMVAAMILQDEVCGNHSPYGRVFAPQRFHLRASFCNMMVDAGVSVKNLFLGLFCRPRCTHLGCKLEWNPEEKSWDCPCHGSRFAGNGEVLAGPAAEELEEK